MINTVNNFKDFINHLKLNKINYAILGRTSSLHDIIDGDIDIVLSAKDFKNIEKEIAVFCSDKKLSFIQSFQHESTSKYIIISDDCDHSIICPDICSHYIRNKRSLIHNNDLISNTTSVKIDGFEINTLVPEYEFLYYFLKKIDKSRLNHTAFKHLSQQYRLASEEKLNKILSKYFYHDTIITITEIFKKQDYNLLENQISNLKKEIHHKTPIKLKYILKDITLKLKRIFNKTGLSVTFMGPDGCGKSTIISGVSEDLSKAFRKTDYYHLKPIKTNNNITVVNPQAERPYSFFKSIIKLIYLVYQYNKGFFKIRLKLIKSTFVIFDRYIEDILVDNLRFRYGAPKLFAKIALMFIPKPQLYIYLDAPGEIIYKRKKELSVTEINRQRQEYLKLFKGINNRYIVDASKKQDEVIFDVEKIILKYLEARQKKRT